jgi:hypothetical protein
MLLSAEGLRRAASASDNAFVFIGKNCQIRCTQVQAAFISPRVESLLKQDKTIDSFWIDCESSNMNEKRVFRFFEDLMNGLRIDPRGFDREGVLAVATFLGNTELINHFIQDDSPIDKSSVCFRLRRKSVIGSSIEEEISFAASHFCELEVADLKGIDVSVLERIVTSEKLCLKDEDSLLRVICALGREDEIVLLRHLRSEYLSTGAIKEFLCRLPVPNVDRALWDSICYRLCLSVSGVEPEPPREEEEEGDEEEDRLPGNGEFPWRKGETLNGIIRYLTKRYKGNVHRLGIVTITSDSIDPDLEYDVANVVDFGSRDGFRSDGLTRWICWDFRRMRVRLTGYEMYHSYLQSWIIEGSQDRRNWTEIHHRTDSINEYYSGSRVDGNQPTYRFIRLTQTDQRWDTGSLYLEEVEFYGTLSFA